jgi:hypothetical protein
MANAGLGCFVGVCADRKVGAASSQLSSAEL